MAWQRRGSPPSSAPPFPLPRGTLISWLLEQPGWGQAKPGEWPLGQLGHRRSKRHSQPREPVSEPPASPCSSLSLPGFRPTEAQSSGALFVPTHTPQTLGSHYLSNLPGPAELGCCLGCTWRESVSGGPKSVMSPRSGLGTSPSRQPLSPSGLIKLETPANEAAHKAAVSPDKATNKDKSTLWGTEGRVRGR